MKKHLVFLSIVFMSAAGAYAQQATTGTFGYGCGHPLEPYATTLSYVGVPRIGSTFTVAYQTPTWNVGRVSAWGNLLTGSSNTHMLGSPLPIAAWYTIGGFVGAPHCMIWTSSEWYTAFTAGYPQGQVQLAVPLDARLVGLRLYQQWVISWLLCDIVYGCEGRLYFSNGGVITLGY